MPAAPGERSAKYSSRCPSPCGRGSVVVLGVSERQRRTGWQHEWTAWGERPLWKEYLASPLAKHLRCLPEKADEDLEAAYESLSKPGIRRVAERSG